jgi:hypothetical protein
MFTLENTVRDNLNLAVMEWSLPPLNRLNPVFCSIAPQTPPTKESIGLVHSVLGAPTTQQKLNKAMSELKNMQNEMQKYINYYQQAQAKQQSFSMAYSRS